MGLDQWAVRVKRKYAINDLLFLDNARPKDVYYWRKVPCLHRFMENLYHEKGGDQEFNCRYVRLNVKDLSRLERAIEEGTMPQGNHIGFFFGEHDGDDMESVLEFIKEARVYIKRGYDIYYSSWY